MTLQTSKSPKEIESDRKAKLSDFQAQVEADGLDFEEYMEDFQKDSIGELEILFYLKLFSDIIEDHLLNHPATLINPKTYYWVCVAQMMLDELSRPPEQ